MIGTPCIIRTLNYQDTSPLSLGPKDVSIVQYNYMLTVLNLAWSTLSSCCGSRTCCRGGHSKHQLVRSGHCLRIGQIAVEGGREGGREGGEGREERGGREGGREERGGRREEGGREGGKRGEGGREEGGREGGREERERGGRKGGREERGREERERGERREGGREGGREEREELIYLLHYITSPV